MSLNGARRTVRTIFQALVGFAAMAPLIYAAATQHDPGQAAGWAATALAITGAITRIMALPAVDVFLARFLPFLASAPKDEIVEPERALRDDNGDPVIAE